MGAFWDVLGVSWRSWGALRGLGCLGGGLLGPRRVFLGASWGPLGGLVGPSWGHLGTSWGLLGASWGHLGGDRSTKGGSSITPPSGAPKIASWTHLGAFLERSWDRLGGLLVPYWAPVGPSWSDVEASDGHRKRKSDNAENMDWPYGFEAFWPGRGVVGELFWPLRPVLEQSWNALEHLRSYIEASRAILNYFRRYLGLL